MGKDMTVDTYFRPRRLGHANLWVQNLKRSEQFYNEVCGLTVEFTEPGLIASFLGTGHTPHDLGMIEMTDGSARYGKDGLLQIPAGIGTKKGLNHIAWELENEADLVTAIKKFAPKTPNWAGPSTIRWPTASISTIPMGTVSSSTATP